MGIDGAFKLGFIATSVDKVVIKDYTDSYAIVSQDTCWKRPYQLV